MYYLGQKLQTGTPYLESLSKKVVSGHPDRSGVIRQVREISEEDTLARRVVSLNPKIKNTSELNNNSSLALVTT